jgi:uncharacterized protein (TIGR03437 family)
LTPGAYIFADYCFGTIYVWENGRARTVFDLGFGITSFGEDEAGELYVCSDNGNIYRLINAPGRALSNVSAASFLAALAPESIVAAFGTGLATGTQSATTTPLPTVLQETRVTVFDSAGTERLAPLFFVSPNQINYQMPPNTAPGQGRVMMINSQGAVFAQNVNITRVAPAIFTANTTGSGLPAAVLVRVRADGSQVTEPIARFDPAQNQFVAIPIDLGDASQQVFLALFGTGFRFVSPASAATATIGGLNAPVTFAGAQGQLVGVDQANLNIPRSLAGRGEVDVVLMIEGQAANTVRVNMK